ncbi:MAG: hypothetical protein V3S46_03575 [Nitrospinota bacterium]
MQRDLGALAGRSVFAVSVALFIAGAALLFWKETSQINLKSGKELLEKGSPASSAAIEILSDGGRKNPHNYQIRYNLAMALQKKAFTQLQSGADARPTLLEARINLESALELRVDSLDYLLLAENFQYEGRFSRALAYYNLSFFLSHDKKELRRWKYLRVDQARVAREYFIGGEIGISLIMAYNAVTDFRVLLHESKTNKTKTDRSKIKSEAEVFLSEYFLSTSPKDWTGAGNGTKPALKELFNKRETRDKEKIVQSLKGRGLAYLAEFLISG